MIVRMLHRFLPALPLLAALLPAQAPASGTWMDLAAGTDLGYAIEDTNTLTDAGGGTGAGGSGTHEVRILALGPNADGIPRIAIFDVQLPKESFETPILRAEIAELDRGTGTLRRTDASGGPAGEVWSPMEVFPFPPLSPEEWKGRQTVSRTAWAPVAGEPRQLPMRIGFPSTKGGRRKVPSLLVELDSKQPVPVRLVGIAGIVGMAQGKMPKLGASGIEPVDANVTALRREYTIDLPKGHVTEIHTTGTVTAADGKVTVTCNHTQRETSRRIVPAKQLPLVVEVAEAVCALIASDDDKAERKQRAEQLLPKAKEAGLEAIAAHLLDSLSRDGLPPGIGR